MNAGGRAPTELARRSLPSRSRLAAEAPGGDPVFQEPNMNKHITLLAFAFATASTAAGANGMAQDAASASFAHTDLAPYTDIGLSDGRGGAPASNQWKGDLSRADVLAALRAARAEGTIPVGEAIDYPYPMKSSMATAEAMPRTMDDGRILGGPPQTGVTSDGYRFVGGEAGYIFVGRPMR
jgi:hypothetical protein